MLVLHSDADRDHIKVCLPRESLHVPFSKLCRYDGRTNLICFDGGHLPCHMELLACSTIVAVQRMEKVSRSEFNGLDSKLEEMLRNREDKQRLMRLSSNGSYSTSQYPLPLEARPPAQPNSVTVQTPSVNTTIDKPDAISSKARASPPKSSSSISSILTVSSSVHDLQNIPPPAKPLPTSTKDRSAPTGQDEQQRAGKAGDAAQKDAHKHNNNNNNAGGGHNNRGGGGRPPGGHGGEQGEDTKQWWKAIGDHVQKHRGGGSKGSGQKGLGHPEGINGDYGRIDGDELEGGAPRGAWSDGFDEAGNCSKVMCVCVCVLRVCMCLMKLGIGVR
jgi:hypothetical protein